MNWLHTILLAVTALVCVFFEASFNGFRQVFGAQIDFLPALMVYAGMTNNVFTIALVALCGGLSFDSFSANPLGVSVLPLVGIGLLAYSGREWVWRDHRAGQFFMGAGASAVQALAVLFVLVNIGVTPPLGWKSLWQLLVMAVGGGVFSPFVFALFNWIHRAFEYQPASQPSFRADREIKRGRN